MKVGIKRLAVVFMALTLLIANLSSCSNNRTYDEATVTEAAERLIKSSEGLNEIYYGKGILYEPDLNYANGNYYRASQASLDSFGIKDLDDLKTKTRDVYSQYMANFIINTKLSAINDDNGILSFARYYEHNTSGEKYMMVFRDAEVYLDGETEYDYSSLKALRSKGEVVYVSISATVYNSEGESQKRELEIGLVEEGGVWKLDTPTYIKYADLDYYDKIQGNK